MRPRKDQVNYLPTRKCNSPELPVSIDFYSEYKPRDNLDMYVLHSYKRGTCAVTSQPGRKFQIIAGMHWRWRVTVTYVTRQREPFNSMNNQPLLSIPRIFKWCFSSVDCSRKVFERNSVIIYLLYDIARCLVDGFHVSRFNSCLCLLL